MADLILEGNLTAGQQAIGTAKANEPAPPSCAISSSDKASGLDARLIERHQMRGLAVAPPG
jgi:hypothetical protein